MSKSQDEVRNGFSLGVLIIGSLCWDRACHRKKWREKRLNWDRKQRVRAPIRYGRLSKSGSWGDSYTMVFSTRLGAEDYGRAIVAPCSRRVRNAADLVDEAVHLWTAETPNGKNPECRVSAKYGWGCVGLLPNPHGCLPADLLDVWRQRVSGEPCYGKLDSAPGEDAAVDKRGILTIPWPKCTDGSALEVDVILATATNPKIVKGSYATPDKIADAWNKSPESAKYFWKNRKNGIRTFEDDCIQKQLRAR